MSMKTHYLNVILSSKEFAVNINKINVIKHDAFIFMYSSQLTNIVLITVHSSQIPVNTG